VSAVLRLRQGVRGLLAGLRPVDFETARSILSPAEYALFLRLRRIEQLHSLNVLRSVRAAGESDPDLLAAALLHDVGKTVAPFTFPERVLVVLVRRFAPALYMRWGQGPPHGWTRAFAISQRHPVWSAELLAEAGSRPAVVALARRHQEHFPGPPRDDLERLLLVLQTADELN
jgi:hypothetical protein